MPPALELRGIQKHFGRVTALAGVDFTLREGDVHALLGENGAGKTTLMRIAFGLVQPDAGSIAVWGTSIHLSSPADARRAGVGMVHQHFTSIPAFTVRENVMLAGGWRERPSAADARIRQLGDSVGFPLDPAMPVSSLSAGDKQRLEVLKALAADARVLLLDEPTSVLSPADGDELLRQLGRLKTLGVSSVLITHKLREALQVADQITVLRQGQVAYSGASAGQTAESLAGSMLGGALVGQDRPASLPRGEGAGDVVVRAEGLVVPRLDSGGSGLRDATLRLAAGELVGVAAVEGNGQRELFRALAGVVAPAAGRLEVVGPVSFVPEDRTSEALIEEFTLTENLVLSQGKRAPWVRGPWIQWPRAAARADVLIGQFGVRAPGAGARAGALSGGNQQRMILAGALERRPRLLLAENPSRGLDLKATDEIMRRLAAAAESGVAVLVHLPDLDDLLGLVSRVVVLHQGRVLDVPLGSGRERIGRMMLGADPA